MYFAVEVLDCPPPDPSPLLAAFQAAFNESLSREQDKLRQSAPERFASLVESLRRGESQAQLSDWKHLSATVLMCADATLLLATVEVIPGATATIGPVTPGSPIIAIVTAPAASWRDAVTRGLADEWPVVTNIFTELYKSFCKRGYAAMWRDFTATTVNGRLLLEHK